MKYLTEHNRQVQDRYKPVGALVRCPNCTHKVVEMALTNPGVILPTAPPTESVYCPECGYKDYKYR